MKDFFNPAERLAAFNDWKAGLLQNWTNGLAKAPAICELEIETKPIPVAPQIKEEVLTQQRWWLPTIDCSTCHHLASCVCTVRHGEELKYDIYFCTGTDSILARWGLGYGKECLVPLHIASVYQDDHKEAVQIGLKRYREIRLTRGWTNTP